MIIINRIITHCKSSLSILLLLSVVFLSFLPKVSAISIDSQVQAIAQIEALSEDSSASPAVILASVEQVIDSSEQQQWPEALLKATLLKTQLLLALGDFNQAQATLQSLQNVEQIDSSIDTLVQIKLLRLSITDALGQVEQNGPLRQELLDYVPALTSPESVAELYLTVGQSQFDAEEYLSAIANLKLAYNYYVTLDDSRGLLSVLTSLGNIDINAGNLDNGLAYYRQALIYAQSSGYRLDESVLLYNIGSAYFNLEKYELALQTLKQAMSVSMDLDDHIGVTWAEHLTARVYAAQGRWQESLLLFEQAVNHFDQLGLKLMAYRSHIDKANALRELGRLEEAEQSLNLAETYLTDFGTPSNRLLFIKALAKLKHAKGEYRSAFEQLEQALDIQKDINSEVNMSQVQRYRIEFDSEIIERQNRDLTRENELSSLLLSQQKQLQIVWIALITTCVILLLSLGFFLYRQIQKRKQYQALAHKDPLTQAPNRRAILQMAKLQFKRATPQEYCIALLDIDNFKMINDSYGHDAGDDVLRAFAQACKSAIRQQDRFGRYGGEEWLLVFEHASPQHIEEIFERLRTQLALLKPKSLPESSVVTFSMGVATFDTSKDASVESIITRADNMLYNAKREGKNRIVIDVDVASIKSNEQR